jgi:hypothetical protein
LLSQQGLFHKAVLSSSASLAIIASQRYIRIRGRGSAPSPLEKAMVVAASEVGYGEVTDKSEFEGLKTVL